MAREAILGYWAEFRLPANRDEPAHYQDGQMTSTGMSIDRMNLQRLARIESKAVHQSSRLGSVDSWRWSLSSNSLLAKVLGMRTPQEMRVCVEPALDRDGLTASQASLLSARKERDHFSDLALWTNLVRSEQGICVHHSV